MEKLNIEFKLGKDFYELPETIETRNNFALDTTFEKKTFFNTLQIRVVKYPNKLDITWQLRKRNLFYFWVLKVTKFESHMGVEKPFYSFLVNLTDKLNDDYSFEFSITKTNIEWIQKKR